MGRAAAVAVAAALLGGIVWLALRDDPPAEVNFARVYRGRLVSRLVTNGRIEAGEAVMVSMPRDGRIVRVAVKEGARVAAGGAIAQLDTSDLQTELAAARARLAEAKDAVRLAGSGPGRTARAEIDAAIERSRRDRDDAAAKIPGLERLVAKEAAPRSELSQMRERVRALDLEIEGLRKRRESTPPDSSREPAEARVRESEAAISEFEGRLAQSTVRTREGGVVYELTIRNPGVARAGETIARVGKVDPVKALIYVDEPELGRVTTGMAVRITWDGQPNREWTAAVTRMPSQIVALNSRQVGEVECEVANADGMLLPGANVNAELVTKVSEGVLLAPTGAIRRAGSETGVWVLSGERIEWRAVTIGGSSATETEIISGVSDGESVALGAYDSLRAGDRVRTRYP
ncbi:MAG: efflux RND transporter periplasmic adaptor subunit [Bryobacteraceae bacterium]